LEKSPSKHFNSSLGKLWNGQYAGKMLVELMVVVTEKFG
jgi:hypothetical protein